MPGSINEIQSIVIRKAINGFIVEQNEPQIDGEIDTALVLFENLDESIEGDQSALARVADHLAVFFEIPGVKMIIEKEDETDDE